MTQEQKDIKQLDSNDEDEQKIPAQMPQQTKSDNKTKFTFQNPFTGKNITIDSCFPSGNLGSAQVRFMSKKLLFVDFKGNSDVVNDLQTKGPLHGSEIRFTMQNVNSFRKFVKQKNFKPFIVYRTEDADWSSIQQGLQINLTEDQTIQATFTMNCPVNKTSDTLCYQFALNYPYTLNDLEQYLDKQQQKVQVQQTYLNVEQLCYSQQMRKTYLITITSKNNIASFLQKQQRILPEMFPESSKRPFKLKKNRPYILFTARVHPSQIASSYYIEGLINLLLKQDDERITILKQLFIFCIVPMLNPDGVQSGNYRLDNQLRNLNRFYGNSSFQATPSIKAAQSLISYFSQRTQNGLIMYFDVHGHNSPKPSFIFGNHTKNLLHATENRLFCKLINKFTPNFRFSDCEFSVKNMTVKEKYDEHSKLGSGRVYAGQRIPNQTQKSNRICFHSYTIEVAPYPSLQIIATPRKIQLSISQGQTETLQSQPTIELAQRNYDFRQNYRNLAENTLYAIVQLFEANPKTDMDKTAMNNLRKAMYKIATTTCLQIHQRKLLQKSIKQKSTSLSQQIKLEYLEKWFGDGDIINEYNQGLFKETQLLQAVKAYIQKLNEMKKKLHGSSRKQLKCLPLQEKKIMLEKKKFQKKQATQRSSSTLIIQRTEGNQGKQISLAYQKLKKSGNYMTIKQDIQNVAEVSTRNQFYSFKQDCFVTQHERAILNQQSQMQRGQRYQLQLTSVKNSQISDNLQTIQPLKPTFPYKRVYRIKTENKMSSISNKQNQQLQNSCNRLSAQIEEMIRKITRTKIKQQIEINSQSTIIKRELSSPKKKNCDEEVFKERKICSRNKNQKIKTNQYKLQFNSLKTFPVEFQTKVPTHLLKNPNSVLKSIPSQRKSKIVMMEQKINKKLNLVKNSKQQLIEKMRQISPRLGTGTIKIKDLTKDKKLLYPSSVTYLPIIQIGQKKEKKNFK